MRVERGAVYWTYVGPDGRRIDNVAWSYPSPSPGYEAIRDHLAFYAGRVDEAWVGDERATPQPGHFYGGWVTVADRRADQGRAGLVRLVGSPVFVRRGTRGRRSARRVRRRRGLVTRGHRFRAICGPQRAAPAGW